MTIIISNLSGIHFGKATSKELITYFHSILRNWSVICLSLILKREPVFKKFRTTFGCVRRLDLHYLKELTFQQKLLSVLTLDNQLKKCWLVISKKKIIVILSVIIDILAKSISKTENPLKKLTSAKTSSKLEF